ncbi:MAG: (Fe-S)-binding protein [Verrucomicrobiota bacterium]
MEKPGPHYLKDLDYSVVQQCMHCGMCLPSCPTYQTTGREKNSPRGRIALMRAVADEELPVDRAFGEELQYCLGCLACQSACPANVDYAHLFEMSRAEVESSGVLDQQERRFYRAITLNGLFRYPRLLRLAGRLLRIYQTTGIEDWLNRSGWLHPISPKWSRLLTMSPKMGPAFSHQLIQSLEKPHSGTIRYRVGVLTGCIQDLTDAATNRATVDVLLANQCEVTTPSVQSCCGSLHAHNGDVDLAREMARRTIDAFDLETLDAVISNAGGCGSHLKHFGRLLSSDPDYAEKARRWDEKLKDIHEWLVAIDFRAPAFSSPLKVAYHQSCHLCHGQKIVREPIVILESLPGLTLVPLSRSDQCCGSAGIYSITQPGESDRLLKEKIEAIAQSKADCLVTSNPGCDVQIRRGLDIAGISITVSSPVKLLAEAYKSEDTHNSPT